MIKTDKKLSALRQTIAAIEHYEKKDYECAITLAGAAEGQIPEQTTNHLFRVLRKGFGKEDVNAYITWMKHPTGPEKVEITQEEVVITIARAIQKFVGSYKTTHVKFEDFSQAAVQMGLIPRPLTEKAEAER